MSGSTMAKSITCWSAKEGRWLSNFTSIFWLARQPQLSLFQPQIRAIIAGRLSRQRLMALAWS
jgi:hypothetical protein